MKCEMTSPSVEEYAPRARSTHGVQHAIVEVNIVVDVCDAAVRRTLVLIAPVVTAVFVVAIFHGIFVYGNVLCTPPVGDGKLLLAVTEF